MLFGGAHGKECIKVDLRRIKGNVNAIIFGNLGVDLAKYAKPYVTRLHLGTASRVIRGIVRYGGVGHTWAGGKRRQIFDHALERVEICISVHADREHLSLVGEFCRIFRG